MRALLIQQPYLDQILKRKKTWEIRGSRTNIRERIALIASGTGTVLGVCELKDCIGPLSAKEYRENARKVGITPDEAKLGHYKTTYAWVLSKAMALKKPVEYQHPYGAIAWVRLENDVERAVLRGIGK